MPRVTAEHLAARRQQILDAAGRCFARNGFHATSMQDVLAEVGLSAGAVYRYFPGKEAIIREIAAGTVGSLVEELTVLSDAAPPPPLLDVLRALLQLADPRPETRFRLAVQVWSESLRSPELALSVAESYRLLRAAFVRIAERARDSGELPPDGDVEQVGSVLFSSLLGYLLQRLFVGDVELDGYLSGVRTLLDASRTP